MKRPLLILKMLILLLMVPSYLYAYDFNVDGIFYNIVKDNIVSVTYQNNKVETSTYKGDLIIPSSVSYNNTSYIVTYIGNEAFRDCKNLTSVSIPNSVISIGDEAFWYCSGLSDMIIPNSVTSIGKKALANCSNLASVTISSNATSLENSTFWGCSSLTSVTIPNSITSIDNYAFYECCNLTSLVIGNSVTSIGSYAFSGCKNITSVNLPNSVTSIGVSAFANCSNLASVSIPNSVTFIGGESFQLCSSLTSITIPNSVTDIGGSAFSLCSGLTTIISEIEKPFRISESTFSEETYNNAELIIPKGTGKAYSSAGGWKFKHIVEAGGVTDYTLSIKSEGNGNASYDGETIRNITKSFTITEGSNATIEFNPDYGYRIKSVKVNSADVTSNVSNNSYTISSISANTTLEVEFEAIPIPTYTLSISATGNGSATYNGTSAKNNTQTFTLNEGTSATITFAPDNGYRIKSVKVNSTDVTSSVSNNSYTISSVSANTTVEVEFEAIPIPTYTLSVTASGNGSATYNGTIAKNNTQSFTLNEGTSVIITFSPDNGYRIKSVKVNSMDVTSSVSNNSYTVSISGNTTIEVEFEAIPANTYILKYVVDGETYKTFELEDGTVITPEAEPTKEGYSFSGWSEIPATMPAYDVTITGTFIKNEPVTQTYTLTIGALGNGYISYNNIPVQNDTQSFSIEAGVSAVVTIHPDEGYQNKKVTINGLELADLSTMSFTIDAMDEDVTIEVEFEQMDSRMTINGVNYEVVSFSDHTMVVADGDYGPTLEVPATVNKGNDIWTVMGLKNDALEQSENLAAVIWDPSAVFNARVSNPNLLLYVNDDKYASRSVKNVVVNGVAESIELTDAVNCNDFYCPRAFRARNIVYSHNYQMETGIGDSRGWETIVLPFDVQKYTHATKGELESFTTWSNGSNKKPFWLFELTASGYKDVAGIKANTPYIISMPNNKQYEQQYQIPGIVTFSASDVEVQKSDDQKPVSYQGRTFVPNYTNKSDDNYLPLNVSNNYVTNPSKEIAGSKFIRGLRAVHPFEAYMTTTDNTRSIDVMDGMTTAIKGIQMVKVEASVIKVYDARGVLLKTATCMDDVKKGLKAGVYIVNGKKLIIK